jgi:RNA polymerase sigma-70 factor (ECF subfamily)
MSVRDRLRPERTDGEVVRRVLDGDQRGFATLVRRHQDALFRQARGMGLDPDTAEDIVQDVFVKAYVRLKSCRKPDRFRSWVFRILRNACLDHLKDIRRRTVPFERAAPGGEEAFGTATHAEVRHEIADALQRLTPLLREAFLLKHEGGYTYDEVADMTESSPSAVKMRVHRAREELRALLSGAVAEAM